jgi:hypothetical protein
MMAETPEMGAGWRGGLLSQSVPDFHVPLAM